MKEYFTIVLAVALLGVVSANLGLDLAYFFGSPGIEYGSHKEARHNSAGGGTALKLPHIAAWIASTAQSEQDAPTNNTKKPAIDQTGDSTWVILQGLSAPVNAFFAFVLLCVGYGQLKAILRQADISEKTLIPAERAYMFLQRIEAHANVNSTSGEINWIFDAVWQNVGKTPTGNLQLYTRIFVEEFDIPPTFRFPVEGELPVTIAGPGGFIQGVSVGTSGAALVSSQAGKSFIYVWGWAKYH